jgi:hypothetical protein
MALAFGLPVCRSKALSQLPFASPGPGMPQPETSLEHAQSVPAASSASRPKIERVSCAAGAIHGSAEGAPGAARMIPPSAMLPM